MREMTFVAINGDTLVMSDADGERHALPLSQELRAALREASTRRAEAEAEKAEYRPKDIQQMLRAGATVDEICELSGLPASHVERYEGPVVAERNWAIESAHGFVVGHGSDSPTLGELVINRLATRNITDVEWDAVREGTGPWHVIARYAAAGTEAEAIWEADLSTRTVRALDDESRWLSETDAGSPRARRHLGASVLYNAEDDGTFSVSPDDPEPVDDSTDSLLRQLHSSRGVRQSEDDLLANILDGDDDIPAAHPPMSAPHEAIDAVVLPLPISSASSDTSSSAAAAPENTPPAEDLDEPTTRRPRSRRRQSVPSWDEIVFGSDN